MKMHSPTRKRHRLAQSSSPAPGTPAAVAAAGDLAAEAVLQAAAAAKTPAEAAAAAEKVAEVVKGAAAEAVGGRASPPAGLNSENGDGAEVGVVHPPSFFSTRQKAHWSHTAPVHVARRS